MKRQIFKVRLGKFSHIFLLISSTEYWPNITFYFDMNVPRNVVLIELLER